MFVDVRWCIICIKIYDSFIVPHHLIWHLFLTSHQHIDINNIIENTMGYLRQDLSDPYYATSDVVATDPTAPWLYQDSTEGAEATGGGTDWTLSSCCGTDEIIFLSLTAGYLVIIYFLWNSAVMKPMKLIAVFVHGKWLCSIGIGYHCIIIILSRISPLTNIYVHQIKRDGARHSLLDDMRKSKGNRSVRK